VIRYRIHRFAGEHVLPGFAGESCVTDPARGGVWPHWQDELGDSEWASSDAYTWIVGDALFERLGVYENDQGQVTILFHEEVARQQLHTHALRLSIRFSLLHHCLSFSLLCLLVPPLPASPVRGVCVDEKTYDR
jgi:hypothetical protein